MTKQETLSASEYQRLYGSKKLIVPTKTKSLKGRPSTKENPVMDSISFWENSCTITLAGTIPGLNGKNGLAHQHWSEGEKKKKEYMWRIAALKPTKFIQPVVINYKRYGIKLLDTDNCVSSFKKLGDALKLNKIIVDDSPTWLTLNVSQEKCKRKDTRVTIEIKNK